MGTFSGARRYVLHTFATTQSAMMKKRVARYMVGTACPVCDGKRLKREALSVTFAGLDIGALSQLSLSAMADALRPAAEGRFDAPATCGTRSRAAGRKAQQARAAAGGPSHVGSSDVRRTPDLSEEKRIAAQRIAQDLVERIGTLQALGLGYLSMDRATPTLSPGELQRLRLATQIRSSLFGVVYVLDEPSAGLHPADGAGAVPRAGPAQGRRQYAVRGRARPGDAAPRRLAGRRGPGRRRAWRAGAVQRAARRACARSRPR